MGNRQTYIIADLVKDLGVARTTLNDWMVRYEQYIESEVRGHRKIYFASSLNVLKDIAEMRDAGKTSSEILNELANKHPVNADIAPELPREEKKISSLKKETSLETLPASGKKKTEEMGQLLVRQLQSLASELHETQLDSMLPIVKKETEKLEKMLVRRLQDMALDLHQIQLDANHLAKQSSNRLLLVIALVLTLGVALIMTTSNIKTVLTDQQKEFDSSQQNLKKNISENKLLLIAEGENRKIASKQQEFKLKNIAAAIASNNKDSRQNINNLKADLAAQQKTFDLMMSKHSSTVLQKSVAEIRLLKKAFEQDRRTLLEKMDKLIKEKAQILELQKKVFELREKIDVLEKEKTKVAKDALF